MIATLLGLFVPLNVHWHLLPLVLVISLVYSATRHEDWSSIRRHATSLFLYILVCLLVVFAGLFGLHLWL
jgi:uncharacterized membrane protein